MLNLGLEETCNCHLLWCYVQWSFIDINDFQQQFNRNEIPKFCYQFMHKISWNNYSIRPSNGFPKGFNGMFLDIIEAISFHNTLVILPSIDIMIDLSIHAGKISTIIERHATIIELTKTFTILSWQLGLYYILTYHMWWVIKIWI